MVAICYLKSSLSTYVVNFILITIVNEDCAFLVSSLAMPRTHMSVYEVETIVFGGIMSSFGYMLSILNFINKLTKYV